ncbi:MAG: DedA family protein [Epsilonproteobacteria bacterium]|nr:DedA family protein [Campylobacterota bacterium]
MIHEYAQLLVDTIFAWGYVGIFLLMAIESSFIPFPSEIVLIPAGYLVSQGQIDMTLVMLSALGGSLLGALVNYFLAFFVGRAFLMQYGKYFFISHKSLHKMDTFFEKHGAISTFVGRLIPAIRQLISIPAGLAGMNLAKFSFYTALGAGMWSLVLVLLGYIIGENQELINQYLKEITIVIFIVLIMTVAIYYRYNKKKGE